MKLFYNKLTGKVLGIAPQIQTAKSFFHFSPPELRKNVGEIALPIEFNTRDFDSIVVKEGVIVRLDDTEILEMKEYGRILSAEERETERKLNNLIPSKEEVQKAQRTIEYIELMEEIL